MVKRKPCLAYAICYGHKVASRPVKNPCSLFNQITTLKCPYAQALRGNSRKYAQNADWTTRLCNEKLRFFSHVSSEYVPILFSPNNLSEFGNIFKNLQFEAKLSIYNLPCPLHLQVTLEYKPHFYVVKFGNSQVKTVEKNGPKKLKPRPQIQRVR